MEAVFCTFTRFDYTSLQAWVILVYEDSLEWYIKKHDNIVGHIIDIGLLVDLERKC